MTRRAAIMPFRVLNVVSLQPPAYPWGSRRLRRALISIRMSRLRPKDNEHNPANNRQQVQEMPPAASINIVQPPRPYRDTRQKCRDAKSPRQVVANRLKSQARHNREQKPPPKLRPRCAAVELRILGETDFDRIDEVHIPSPPFLTKSLSDGMRNRSTPAVTTLSRRIHVIHHQLPSLLAD